MATNSRALAIRPITAAIATLFRAPASQIKGVETSDFFGPLQPVKPQAPEGTEPRRFQYIPGQNLIYTPRADEPPTAKELRDWSMYDLVRMVIENVEDVICQMPINVRLKKMPGENGKEYAKRKPDKAIIQRITELINYPNPEQTRADFTRQVIDDMLVVDAASVLKRVDAKKKLVQLRAIDGATITKYIDEQGYQPLPPSPAFAQVWYGLPMVDLTSDQLIYAARNVKTYRLYGMSPVEQIIRYIQTGSARLASQQLWYTSGTIPDAIQVVPLGVNPDKIKESQDSMISQMSGMLAKRIGGLRLMQGFTADGKDQFIFPKEKALTDPFDDLLINAVCFALKCSKQRLQKMMNRATAQENQEASEKEGTEVFAAWYLDAIWNRVIQRDLGFREYEASYEDTQEIDPVKQAVIDKSDISIGLYTINEKRERRGDDPRPEPEADEPIIITASGPVPLSMDSRVDAASQMAEAMHAGDPDSNGNGPGGKPGKKPAKPAGKKPAGKAAGGSEGADPKAAKRAATASEVAIDPARRTPATHHAENEIRATLTRLFHRQRDRAVDVVDRHVRKVSKVTEPSSLTAAELAALIYQEIQTEFKALPPDLKYELERAALAGVSEGILQLNVSDSNMISSVNRLARDYADKRAAEMIGMRFDDEGFLVENPNAEWVISDTTRDEIRRIVKNAFDGETKISDLANDIKEAGIFSDARAEMIARTEVAHAQVQGNWQVWKHSGVVKEVKWRVSADHSIVDECDDNNGAEVEFGKAFPSGDLYPPAHPRCECVIYASKID